MNEEVDFNYIDIMSYGPTTNINWSVLALVY